MYCGERYEDMIDLRCLEMLILLSIQLLKIVSLMLELFFLMAAANGLDSLVL